MFMVLPGILSGVLTSSASGFDRGSFGVWSFSNSGSTTTNIATRNYSDMSISSSYSFSSGHGGYFRSTYIDSIRLVGHEVNPNQISERSNSDGSVIRTIVSSLDGDTGVNRVTYVGESGLLCSDNSNTYKYNFSDGSLITSTSAVLGCQAVGSLYVVGYNAGGGTGVMSRCNASTFSVISHISPSNFSIVPTSGNDFKYSSVDSDLFGNTYKWEERNGNDDVVVRTIPNIVSELGTGGIPQVNFV